MLSKKFNLMKCFISLVTVIGIFLSCSYVNLISASEESLIQPRSNERLVCTADQGLGDYGYVTCTVLIDYNIQARTYKVAGCYVTPHFNIVEWPLLEMKGTPTSNPDSGELVTNGVVTVNFKFGMKWPIGTVWSESCKVRI